MNLRIAMFFWIFTGFVNSQAQDAPGAFFSGFQAAVNFCQIDGDAASGFNKFGYTVGTSVGQSLGKGWSYETGISLSERGSRRPFDPDLPATAAFHYQFRTVDIPVFLGKSVNQKLSVGAGFRTTLLISARETEQIHLHLKEDVRKTGLLACAKVGYVLDKHWQLQAEYQYGLVSIMKQGGGSLWFPTGAYHHCISAGCLFVLSSGQR